MTIYIWHYPVAYMFIILPIDIHIKVIFSIIFTYIIAYINKYIVEKYIHINRLNL